MKECYDSKPKSVASLEIQNKQQLILKIEHNKLTVIFLRPNVFYRIESQSCLFLLLSPREEDKLSFFKSVLFANFAEFFDLHLYA